MKMPNTPNTFASGPYAIAGDVDIQKEEVVIGLQCYRGHDHYFHVVGDPNPITDQFLKEMVDSRIESDLKDDNINDDCAPDQFAVRAHNAGYTLSASTPLRWIGGTSHHPARVIYDGRKSGKKSISAFGKTFSQAVRLVHKKSQTASQ